MLVSLIPLFDKNMNVCAYSLFSQKKNFLSNPASQVIAANDNAGFINGVEIINEIGIDTLSPNAPIIVPISNITIFSNISDQCNGVPKNRIIFLIDKTFPNNSLYVKRIAQLKEEGYSFAMRKLPITSYEGYREMLALMDYIFIDCKKIDVLKVKIYFNQLFSSVKLIVGNISNQESFENYSKDEAFSMFEGDFYRIPINSQDKGVTPIKANYLELLNVVNSPDFDLVKASNIIGRDAALVLELLKTVNHIAINSEITSIRHAAAMLGQKELKRWINTVVTKELCSDKPGEVTRISLLRAQFAERLAKLFEVEKDAQELFLMGLFSVIDLMLDIPMEEAVEKVYLSKNIKEALLTKNGMFGIVLSFIEAYERADWEEVARIIVLYNLNEKEVYDIYVASFKWYREVMNL